jgi:hypothetical protein
MVKLLKCSSCHKLFHWSQMRQSACIIEPVASQLDYNEIFCIGCSQLPNLREYIRRKHES